MADHTLDPIVIAVGGGVGIGEDILRVEDIEPFVLHRPHVEVRNRDDIEQIEVVFAPERLLVPFHGSLQALHCMLGPIEISVPDPDVQFHLAAAGSCETVCPSDEVAGHQGEEIGRLGPGIVPFRPVRATFFASIGAVAVAQQYRKLRFRPAHSHRVGAEHIRAIREECDAAKAFRLALRAKHAIGSVQPHQLRIVGRVQFGDDFECMPLAFQRDYEIVAVQHMPCTIASVASDRHEFETIAVQANCRGSVGIRIAFDIKPGDHTRFIEAQIELHPDRRDQPRKRRII